MKDPEQRVIVSPEQKLRALKNLAARGIQMRRNADVEKIARAICSQLRQPMPKAPGDIGRLVLAFGNGVAGTVSNGLPEFRPYIQPKLLQQERMDEFRAIPSLYR